MGLNSRALLKRRTARRIRLFHRTVRPYCTLFHEGYDVGPAGLYLLPLAGGDPVDLLDEEGQDSVNLPGSCWNALTGPITFASDRQDTDEVWTMDDVGGDLFRVTYHTTAG